MDPTDVRAAAAGAGAGDPPPIDSLDQWPALLVPNAAWNASTNPRKEIFLSWNAVPATAGNGASDKNILDVEAVGMREAYGWKAAGSDDRALIKGQYKIVCGSQSNQGFWQGVVFPNSSQHDTNPGCPSCCLFDIINDELELQDLRLVKPSLFTPSSE